MAEEIRGIVRLAGNDLEGTLSIDRAVRKIKGIGPRLGNAIANLFADKNGLSRNDPIGKLSQPQVAELEKSVKEPLSIGIPVHMLNRQKDPVSGENKNLLGPELEFAKREDVKKLQRISSYRGIRHGLGLKTRGQNTRTTGRRHKTIGVKRKKK